MQNQFFGIFWKINYLLVLSSKKNAADVDPANVSGPLGPRYVKFHEELADVLDDYHLTSYTPVAVEDKARGCSFDARASRFTDVTEPLEC